MARSITTHVPTIIKNTTKATVKIPQDNTFDLKRELTIARTHNPAGT